MLTGSEVQSSIGDLVLAAELMEKANEAKIQDVGDRHECIVHDHGEYCVPDDPELLKQMVRELKRTTHQQSQMLQSLQDALDSKEMQCHQLQDGNQGKHRVTKRGPALSYPMFTLVTGDLGIVGRWRAVCVTALQRPNSDAAAIRIVVGIAAASFSVTKKWENEKWMLLSDMGQQITELESEIRNLTCEKEILEKKNKELEEQLERSSGTVLYLGQQVKHQEQNREDSSFCMNSIKNESKWVRFYTGFDSHSHLMEFLGFITADQKLCTGRIWKKTEVGPQSALCLEDQLLLVLTRLRLGLLLQDLAFRFRVSESTVSRYWLNWTELLHARLTQVRTGRKVYFRQFLV
ncbi:unnamed protein product [Ranitomeya imitator]|uniref:Transposase Helix-turn-helix domain-containing protein n=1 Tax=Ranitomeya imitator TaxID=111125 RepID=A0ABN9MW86_9NEOB|nr:unnamed protein product [Ranitomeya imitator]